MRPYRGRGSFDVRDPIVEPIWSGARVIAHVITEARGPRPPRVLLIEDLGADVGGELPGLASALASSILANHAILDGVISRQVGLSGVGAAPITEMRHRPALILRSRTEVDVLPRGMVDEPQETLDGFIAVDLLWLDGTSLLDVPLLERKRLLESVVIPGPLVRTSPHVRPPIDPWLATWKSLGLRGGILKAANSRYRPGEDSVEWRLVERIAGRS
jgi:bifunctional non-homologous end joining protein LigD